MTSSWITYEQPLREHVRVCLRLEQLFNKISTLKTDESPWKTQAIMTAIIDIIMILDRPDLKAKLTKALGSLVNKLAPYENKPHVDQLELKTLLNKLDQQLGYLLHCSGKIAQNLRENELLNDLKQHHSTFGGPTPMDTPAYHYWLHQSEETRKIYIYQWLKELQPLHDITDTILYLTRDGREPQQKVADNGFYFQNFSKKEHYRLIRITVPKSLEAYPEISVGKHRVNIRFYTPKCESRAKPVDFSIPFQLTCCD